MGASRQSARTDDNGTPEDNQAAFDLDSSTAADIPPIPTNNGNGTAHNSVAPTLPDAD